MFVGGDKMSLKRKIMENLLAWKNNENKKCLLIVGARQVGKSFIVKEFSKLYKRVIYINFEESPEMKGFFDGSLNSSEIIDKMRLHIKFKDINFQNFVDDKLLLIFDEIQACPAAITSLKFFTQSKEYDVIGTGSLLGVNLKRVSSYPVGYVEQINMYQLDFEEFLWASGIKDTISLYDLVESKSNIPDFVHNQYMHLFKQYMIVGGMPEIVSNFFKGKSYSTILNMQRQIVEAYKMDIAKYSSDNKSKLKTKECFLSIPFQLAKDNKKFQYKYVSTGGRAIEYDACLDWLIDAGIIYKCNAVSNLEFPLQGYSIPNIFKIYFFDTGLLVSMLDEGTSDKIMSGDLKIYKGAIYGNVVASILKMSGRNLYYYTKDSKWEIDFILNIGGEIIPLEIKSADNTRAKSIDYLIRNLDLKYAIKSSAINQNFDNEQKIIYMPLYLLPFMK